jgi:two-component system, sensor histidine kinase PdtaS
VGDFRSALSNYARYKLLNDSALNETSVKEVERLKVAYETEKKEQALVLANKDAELMRRQLHEAKVTTNIIIIGLIVAVAIAGVIYYLYRAIRSALKSQRDTVNQKNQVVERMLQEKEWLLREVHHRVKNNLHTIVSLLESQSYYLKNEDALAALKQSQNRVNAMSLVHKKLYSSENISGTNMHLYLSELVSYLRDSFETSGYVAFHLNVSGLILSISQAIPVGLIVNEAITNSIKHAFCDRRPGTIYLEMVDNEDSVHLEIRDDGNGFAKSKVEAGTAGAAWTATLAYPS